MTTRERWTIYPLLFLAIGLAVRAAVVSDERAAEGVKTVVADRVVCRELLVTDDEGTILIQLPPDAAEE